MKTTTMTNEEKFLKTLSELGGKANSIELRHANRRMAKFAAGDISAVGRRLERLGKVKATNGPVPTDKPWFYRPVLVWELLEGQA